LPAKRRRPRLLLLDANIVIEAHCLGVWEKLTRAVEIVLPSTIADDEVQFYEDPETGDHLPIDLRQLLANGTITKADATAEELQDLYTQFEPLFVAGIDLGEAEALALLLSGRIADCHFCTADKPAIQALALLGFGDQGISLEALLQTTGVKPRSSLRRGYREAAFQQEIRAGEAMRILDQGLAKGSRFRLRSG
jgi:hypothetical protein